MRQFQRVIETLNSWYHTQKKKTKQKKVVNGKKTR